MMDELINTTDQVFEINSEGISDNHPTIQETDLTTNQVFYKEVVAGLELAQKTLPCKYFYDEKGSQLFEEICQLDEYYLTRTELSLLENIKAELAEMIGNNATIIEPGAGAGIKIRTLLKALDTPDSYVPMDISKEFLFYSAQVIQKEFPQINIMPIQGDFTQPVKWLSDKDNENKIVFFPGSTIGNFEKEPAIEFLVNMRNLIGKNGAMIVGIDLMKDQSILEAAYNDNKGITAAFNKNLLNRINQNLNANFDLNQFKHEARLNHQLQRIEMHLVSQKQQKVTINGTTINFSAGETIHTENSHKYTNDSFLAMVGEANLKCIKTWTDERKMFSVNYLMND